SSVSKKGLEDMLVGVSVTHSPSCPSPSSARSLSPDPSPIASSTLDGWNMLISSGDGTSESWPTQGRPDSQPLPPFDADLEPSLSPFAQGSWRSSAELCFSGLSYSPLPGVILPPLNGPGLLSSAAESADGFLPDLRGEVLGLSPVCVLEFALSFCASTR